MSDNNNNNMAYAPPAARDLWMRLQQWSPDRPGAANPLSRRLQLDNGWTADFTRRAIDEYRRFAYLAMVAGHTVTPSDEVDQVWHAHLLYSRDYWDDFCPRVLGQPLHHQPSDGGPDETRHYRDLYQRTLTSYERAFGEVPPLDLWPAPDDRFGGRYRRVDLRRQHILPRLDLPGRARQLLGRAGRAGLALAAAIGLSGCALLVHPSQPGSLGPGSFLFLYLLLLVGGVALAVGLRRLFTGLSTPGDTRFRRLDAYEMAYLAGRRKRLLQTAAARLHQMGCIAFTGGNRHWIATQPPPEDAHPVEQGLFAHVTGGKTIHGHLTPYIEDCIADVHQTLKAEGLIPGFWAGLLASLAGAGMLAGVTYIGWLGVKHGMIGNQPNLFIVLLAAATLAALLTLRLLRPPRLTGAGRHALRQARLRMPRNKPVGQLDPRLATALALYGLSALANNALADVKAALKPPRSSSDGYAGGGDGGCGSDGYHGHDGGDHGDGGCGGDGGDGGGCGGGCGGD